MSKLTYAEWSEITAPFYWLRTTLFKDKEPIFSDMVEKWLNDTISSWWYRDGDIFVFANKEDRATFKFWVVSGVFEQEYGDVDIDE